MANDGHSVTIEMDDIKVENVEEPSKDIEQVS